MGILKNLYTRPAKAVTGLGIAGGVAGLAAGTARQIKAVEKFLSMPDKYPANDISDDMYNDLTASMGLNTPKYVLNDQDAELLGLVNNAGYYPKHSIKQWVDEGYGDEIFPGTDRPIRDFVDTGVILASGNQNTLNTLAHELGHASDDKYSKIYLRDGKIPKLGMYGSVATALLSPLTILGLRRLGIKKLPNTLITAGTITAPSLAANIYDGYQIVKDEEDANENGEKGLNAIRDKYKDQLPDYFDEAWDAEREAALDTYKNQHYFTNSVLPVAGGLTMAGISNGIAKNLKRLL